MLPVYAPGIPPVSKLSYPAGRMPGVNLSHPILVHTGGILRFSGVCGAGAGNTPGSTANQVNFWSLFPSFKIGTAASGSSSAITTKIDSIIGPGISTTLGANQCANFTGQTTVADAAVITAAIFRTGSSLSALQLITSTGGNAISIQTSAAAAIQVGIPFGTVQSTGVTAAINTPYFVAASVKTGVWAFVVVNLNTGQVFSSTAATAITMPTPSGTVQVLTAASNTSAFGGSVATFMFASGSAGLRELLAWANDPWSFWYPTPMWVRTPVVGKSAVVATINPYPRRNIIRTIRAGFN